MRFLNNLILAAKLLINGASGNAKVCIKADSTGAALNLNNAAPSSPQEGDIWRSGSEIYARVSGRSLPMIGAPGIEFARRSDRYIVPYYWGQYTSLTTLQGSADRLRAYPFIVSRAVKVVSINVYVSGAASGWIRLALYNDNGTGYPGSLITVSSDISVTTMGLKTHTVNQTLAPGLYWLAVHFFGLPTLRAVGNATYGMAFPILGFDSTLQNPANGWDATVIYSNGTPTVFPSGATAVGGIAYAIAVVLDNP